MPKTKEPEIGDITAYKERNRLLEGRLKDAESRLGNELLYLDGLVALSMLVPSFLYEYGDGNTYVVVGIRKGYLGFRVSESHAKERFSHLKGGVVPHGDVLVTGDERFLRIQKETAIRG